MHDVLASLPLLTASTPVNGTQEQAFFFLGGLVALAAMAKLVLGAMNEFRRWRGIDTDDDKRYATKQEHQALRDEVVGIKADFTALSRTINHSFNDLQRSIGRLEGKIDKSGTSAG